MRPVSIGSGGLIVDDVAFAKWCDEPTRVVPPAANWHQLAELIANEWLHAIDYDFAIEAARNAVQVIVFCAAGKVASTELRNSCLSVLRARRDLLCLQPFAGFSDRGLESLAEFAVDAYRAWVADQMQEAA